MENNAVLTGSANNEQATAANGNGENYYTYKDIMKIMGCGRNVAYALIKSGMFPIIKIGHLYKVPIEGFREWKEKADREGCVIDTKLKDSVEK